MGFFDNQVMEALALGQGEMHLSLSPVWGTQGTGSDKLLRRGSFEFLVCGCGCTYVRTMSHVVLDVLIESCLKGALSYLRSQEDDLIPMTVLFY